MAAKAAPVSVQVVSNVRLNETAFRHPLLVILLNFSLFRLPNHMKLRAMKTGHTGIIKAISVQGTLGLRLREMGLIPGTSIKIEGRAPLQDPVKIRLHGQILTLRNNEADHIVINVQEAGQ